MSEDKSIDPTMIEDAELVEKRLQARKIVEYLGKGYTYKETATAMGMHRNTLHALVSGRLMQELLSSELTSLQTKTLDTINKFLESPSVTLQKLALVELNKYQSKLTDKVLPSLMKKDSTSTTSIEHQYQELDEASKLRDHILVETLRRIPPKERDNFWKKWIQVKQDWNIPPDTPITQHTQPPRHDYDKEKILNE